MHLQASNDSSATRPATSEKLSAAEVDPCETVFVLRVDLDAAAVVEMARVVARDAVVDSATVVD